VYPTAGLEDLEKRKILTLPGLKLRPISRPAHSQSLYRLRYCAAPAPGRWIMSKNLIFVAICSYVYDVSLPGSNRPLDITIKPNLNKYYMQLPLYISRFYKKEYLKYFYIFPRSITICHFRTAK
jgi:hypothetical protein